MVTSSGVEFQLNSISFEGEGVNQTFSGLSDSDFHFSISNFYADAFVFGALFPLPDGVLGSTVPLFFYEGFVPDLDSAMVSEFDTIEATDFPILFDSSIILSGGSEISPLSELQNFLDPTIGSSPYQIIGGGNISNIVLIPEPSSTVILFTGFFVLLFRRNR